MKRIKNITAAATTLFFAAAMSLSFNAYTSQSPLAPAQSTTSGLKILSFGDSNSLQKVT